MKSLFLIIFLLVPSISIAGPFFHDCDNSAMLLHLASIEAAISRSQQPAPQSIKQPEPKPIPPQPNKELTLEQMKIKLYLYGGCK